MDFKKLQVGIFNTNVPSTRTAVKEDYSYASLVVQKTPEQIERDGKKIYLGRCGFELNNKAVELMGYEMEDGKLKNKSFFTFVSAPNFEDGRLFCIASAESHGKNSAQINRASFTFHSKDIHEELRKLWSKWNLDVNKGDLHLKLTKVEMSEEDFNAFPYQLFEITIADSDTEEVVEEELEADARQEEYNEQVSNGFFN